MAGATYRLTAKGKKAASMTWAGFGSAPELYYSAHKLLSYIPLNGLTMREIEEKVYADSYFFSTRKNKRKVVNLVRALVRKGYLLVSRG